MKNYTNTGGIIAAMLGFMFILYSCSPWHYNNPRVKVDKQQVNLVQNESEPVMDTKELTVTFQSIEMEKKSVVIDNPEENSEVVASVSNNKINPPVKIKIKDITPVKHTKLKKNRPDTPSYTERFKEKSEVFQVQDVEKTMMHGWLRWMILLFVIGIILIVMGAIFSVLFFGLLWWLFYFFGSLCILAGFIVLILGLVGVLTSTTIIIN